MDKETLDAILRNSKHLFASKANLLNSNQERVNPLFSTTVKLLNDTEKPLSNISNDYSKYSAHTLRTAISGILLTQYDELSTQASGTDHSLLPDAEDWKIILSDFTEESAIYAVEDITPEIETALLTPDYNGCRIAAAAFLMKESVESNTAHAGNELLLMLEALYHTDEDVLLKAAKTSGWLDRLEAAVPSQENVPPDHESATPSTNKRTAGERNYAFLVSYAPSILDSSLDYIRFESDCFEPLYIERISPDRIAIAHTYEQNGDLMLDPEVVFAVDDEKKELLPLSFEQSNPPIYHEVYEDVGTELRGIDREAARSINDFLTIWFNNLEYQGHHPVRGMKHTRDGDIDYTFENGEILPLHEDEHHNTSVSTGLAPLSFGLMDFVVIRDNHYAVSACENGKIQLVSQETGEVLEPIDAEVLSAEIRSHAANALIPAWKRNTAVSIYVREDQNLLANLLKHFDSWRTSESVYIPGKYYDRLQENLLNIRISDNEAENRDSILRVAYAIYRFFPRPDYVTSRARDTSRLVSMAENYLDMSTNLEDTGRFLRYHEWKNGCDRALYSDLRDLCLYYEARIPSNLAQHLSTEKEPDILEAIPAMTAFLLGHEGEGILKAQAEKGYEGILASGLLYSRDRQDLRSGKLPVLEGGTHVDNDPGEPEIDHPELLRGDLSNPARMDKSVLADLLLHYITYRYTFDANTPALSDRDAVRREAHFNSLDAITVSSDVKENLESIRVAKSILTRWFLPFEGIRSEIMVDQEHIISAAEQVLLDPPKQFREVAQEHKHTDTDRYTHTDTEYIGTTGLERADEPTLWDYEDEQPNKYAPSSSTQVRAQPLVDSNGRINYRTGDMEPHYGGPKERFRNNIAAIRLLKQLESEERLATNEEQEILSKYVGWGGLPNAFDDHASGWSKEYQELRELLTDEEYAAARASTLTAFYTPPVVIAAIYQGMEQLGIRSGNLLDAGCGTGAFFGQAPEDAKLYGIEIDSISGRIAQQLYQQASVAIEGFENTRLPDNFFNGMVGNVPFGNIRVFDTIYNRYNFQIHDYFFAKGLDKVRPGGVLALVTSAGTMDKQDEKFRRYLAARADLIGAIRLPNNTFRENAGTDVTSDILFLRKRDRPRVNDPDWVHVDTLPGGHHINSYFTSHPNMILGNMQEISGLFGPQLVCLAKEGQDLKAGLAQAIRHIEDNAQPLLDELDDPTANERISIPADPDIRNYSFAVVEDDVYYREDDRMFRVKAGKMPSRRIKGMVELRNTVHELINAQLQDFSDKEISRLQQQLNEQYDVFSKKFGLINSHGNQLAFSDDSSYYLLCSLEQLDKYGNFIGKADIFNKRTIAAKKEIVHVDTPYEALLVSIGERSRIDLGYMERLSDFTEAELLEELKGQIFEEPELPGTYILAPTYLSGNVREKLAAAQAADEAHPGRYTANVRALEKVIPEPLGPGEISIRLGATWVPADVIRDFMYETFHTDKFSQARRLIDVHYSSTLNQWAIKNKGFERNTVQASKTFGTKEMDAYTILENTLNLKDIRVFREAEDDSGKRVIDIQGTILAQEKQELIKEAFQNWIWNDPNRTKRLCSIYNERFNSYRPPEYDGSILSFHGMSPFAELRKNQKDVVARILFNGNTQIAAEVGAGKTWMMTAAAMEGKYWGQCSKSMICVPNHLIGQWATAVYDLYPAAKVLAVTEKDFQTKNRKKLCSRIATGDYDIVILGHSQLEKIPLSVERQKRYIEEQINEIIDAIQELKAENDSPFTVKQMESKKRSLERTLKKLTESKKRDNVITFEELGIDRLFIDESDEFKNLYLHTKMQNVAGIAQTDAQRASDLFLKCRYMDELTGNKGNIHATGTPLSNTMAELYTHQRFLQYDTLKEMGLHNFDAWVSSFAEVKPVLELAPEGTGYRMRNRLTNFYNLPELMGLYRQIAEIQTMDTLNLPLPNVHYITKSLPPSEAQKAIVQQLAQQAEDIRNGNVRPEEDNMLCVVNDGRKLALDQRLIDPSLPDDPNSKVNAAAEAIYDQWLSGKVNHLTQIVFCDISTPKKDVFNVYDALRDKLIEKGIPRDEICFIHEANSDSKKDLLFSQVRDGSVRVLMGSTGKMGTGTNVQDRLVACHDVDIPWRPRDLTQRNGRMIRIGNTNENVYVYRYVTEGTFDAYMYQLLESKQRFISQIFTSKTPPRQMEDIDDLTISFAEIKGIATGNPLIKERIGLQLDISRLEVVKARHIRNQAEMNDLVNHQLPAKITSDQNILERLSKDAEKIAKLPSRTEDSKYFPITVKGIVFDGVSESGDAALTALKDVPSGGAKHVIAQYRGFDLVAEKPEGNPSAEASLFVKGTVTYPLGYSDKGLGLVQRLNHLLDQAISQRIEDCQTRIKTAQQQIREYSIELGKPFPREDELRKMTARLKHLDTQLNMGLAANQLQSDEVDSPNHSNSLDSKISNAQARITPDSHFTGERNAHHEFCIDQ